MNNASTSEQFHKDVGSKLTIRVVSYRGLVEYSEYLRTKGEQVAEDILVWDARLRPPRRDTVTDEALKMAEDFENLNVYLLHNHVPGMQTFDTLFDSEIGLPSFVTGTSVSCGFYAIFAAAFLCDDVTIYGVSHPLSCANQSQQFVPYHYYQDPYSSVGECDFYSSRWQKSFQGHRFLTEHFIFKRWTQFRSIKLKVPTW